MTWYKRRIAIDLDTGGRHPVVCTLNDFDDDLSPTIFFAYFDDMPIHNAVTQCLDTLDMADFIDNNDIQKKEEGQEAIPDPRIYEKNEGRGVGGHKNKREKEWKKKIKI